MLKKFANRSDRGCACPHYSKRILYFIKATGLKNRAFRIVILACLEFKWIIGVRKATRKINADVEQYRRETAIAASRPPAYTLALVNPRLVLRQRVYGVRHEQWADDVSDDDVRSRRGGSKAPRFTRHHKALSAARSPVLTKVNMSLTRMYGRFIDDEGEERDPPHASHELHVVRSIFRRRLHLNYSCLPTCRSQLVYLRWSRAD